MIRTEHVSARRITFDAWECFECSPGKSKYFVSGSQFSDTVDSLWEIDMKISILLLAIFAALGQWGCGNGSFSWGDGAASQSGSRIQTVEGRVNRVDIQRGTFELSDPLRARVIVSLPYNARSSDVDRLRALQAGDYVRVEGRFLDRERFELENFLRDNR